MADVVDVIVQMPHAQLLYELSLEDADTPGADGV